MFTYIHKPRKSPCFLLICATLFCHSVKPFYFLLFTVFFFLFKEQKAIIITAFKNPACKIISLPWSFLKFLTLYVIAKHTLKDLPLRCLEASVLMLIELQVVVCDCLFLCEICVKCVSECLVARTPHNILAPHIASAINIY